MGEYINLEGTFNFRDLGGLPTQDGRIVKTGCLFRSDALYRLSDKDLKTLQEMQIRTIVDFRSPKEGAAHPNRPLDGVASFVLTPFAEVAEQASASHGDDTLKIRKLEETVKIEAGRKQLQQNLNAMETQMRKLVTTEAGIYCYSSFLKLVSNPDCTPLIFHCKGGKDRTGWGAALILAALGVDRSQIVADYMDTANYNRVRNAKRMEEYRRLTDHPLVLQFLSGLMQVKESYILAAFEEVDKLGGFETYLEDVLHMDAEEKKQLKELYLADKGETS